MVSLFCDIAAFMSDLTRVIISYPEPFAGEEFNMTCTVSTVKRLVEAPFLAWNSSQGRITTGRDSRFQLHIEEDLEEGRITSKLQFHSLLSTNTSTYLCIAMFFIPLQTVITDESKCEQEHIMGIILV